MAAGSLFDESSDPVLESVFRYAIFRLNRDDSILPHTKLLYDIQHLPQDSSFVAGKRGEIIGSAFPVNGYKVRCSDGH